MVQNSDQGNLLDQNYTLSSTATLLYALATKQTPNCLYTASEWTGALTGGPNSGIVNTINSDTGVFQVGPSSALTDAGTYKFEIQKVTLNGVTHDTSPQNFELFVLSPCAAAIVTSTAQTTIVTVFGEDAFYPASGPAFSDFTTSVFATNGVTCFITYSATVSTSILGGASLSVFEFDGSLKKFRVSSKNYD